MNLWNVKYLEPPPITTYKTKSFADIQKLRTHFKKALDFFNSQTFLHKEAALLSRCIYRMKIKFRSDKGLKAMEKLNRTLLQFNYLNISSVLDDFHSLLPKGRSTDLYLPTRNMLEFILVRLQSMALLMQRVLEVAEDAAISMGGRICIGHFWKVALIMLCVVSRIWVICRKVLKTCCDFYKNILPMRKVLQNVSKDWLPDNYIFPDGLEEILKVDFNSGNDQPQWDLFKSIVPIREIIENLHMGECDEFVEVTNKLSDDSNIDNNQQLNNDVNRYRKINAFELLTIDEDLGEVVCESTKKVGNVISISSDSEDGINETNQTFSNNSKTKLNITNKNSRNITGKKKKGIKGNKNKEKLFNNMAAIEIENDLENAEIIEIKSKEKCVKNKPKKDKHLLNTTKVTGKAKKIKSKCNIIENISSLKELKIFIKNESKCRDNQHFTGVLKKMDKLQWTMLRKHIKKFTKRANNKLITDDQCLTEVKRVLKASLDN